MFYTIFAFLVFGAASFVAVETCLLPYALKKISEWQKKTIAIENPQHKRAVAAAGAILLTYPLVLFVSECIYASVSPLILVFLTTWTLLILPRTQLFTLVLLDKLPTRITQTFSSYLVHFVPVVPVEKVDAPVTEGTATKPE